MERIYFSKNNFDVIYNIIGEKIYKKYKVDISDADKYETKMLDLMKSIYIQKKEFNIDFNRLSPQIASNELSKKVLDIVYSFFSKYIDSTIQKPNVKEPVEISQNRIDIRAESSTKTSLDDVNKRYEELQNERYSTIPDKQKETPIFKDNIEEPLIDVNKQYELLSKNRNSELPNEPTIKLNITEPSTPNITNNVLPGKDSQNQTLDAQFGLFTDTNMDDLKQKFEETSVADRLKEYEKMRNMSSFPPPAANDHLSTFPAPTANDHLNTFPPPTANDHLNTLPAPTANDHLNTLPAPTANDHLNTFPPPTANDHLNTFPAPTANDREKTTLNDFFKILEQKKEHNYVKRTYNIVINSIDRQWWGVIDNNETYESSYTQRYKYVVNFAPVSDTSVKVPIYENNKFIPPDLDTLNNEGFTLKGKDYPPYDPTLPKGNVVNTITLLFKGGNDGISINNIIKNVVSVKLKRLVMPNNDISHSVNVSNKPISEQHADSLLIGEDPTLNINVEPRYSNYYTGFKSEPYLFVHMDGYDSNIITSNNFNKSIFAKPHFDKEFRYNSDTNSCSYLSRGWSYFKNEDGDFTEFRPAPLSEITKLSIELLRPDGSLYSSEKDNLEISNIAFYNTDNDSTPTYPDFLKLTLGGGDANGWVQDSYFNNGDKIIVKHIKWLDSGIEWNESIKNTISEYLNKGAYITRWNDDSEEYGISQNRLLNTILVANPLLKLENGELEWDEDLYGEVPENSINVIGFLINYNLQHSLILEMVTEETKNRIVSEII